MYIKKTQIGFLTILFLALCAARVSDPVFDKAEVTRIMKTLSADDMEGRGSFTPGIDRATSFIEDEFRKAGLLPLEGESSFRQEFKVTRILPGLATVLIDGKHIDAANVLAISDNSSLNFNDKSGAQIVHITSEDEFVPKYREVQAIASPVLVLVDPVHASIFKRLQESVMHGHIGGKSNGKAGAVFILGPRMAGTFSVAVSNKLESLPLFNVAGMIPGKSKEKELVVFSAHYDHLGIIATVEGDSIANGADDDASGTTAVISLASYYKKLNNNERTLIFVAFTAEEIGGYGSKYFSSRLNPDEVTAMFNIEMIGKDSKFGKNSAFITGYERSDFGAILQRNLVGTDFKFYPDPYPDQNLFYRSDNATLAALGVPAHTISTDQIDSDKLYHTVKDEFDSLDVNNILATIKAIALSARSIVSGKDTPARLPKLQD